MRVLHCKNKHRMILIVTDLWLCECSAYGRLADLRGAVDEARGLVKTQGGVAAMRRLVEAQEEQARKERKANTADAWQRQRDAIKEGV